MKLPSRSPAPSPAVPDPDLPGYPAGWFAVSRSDALKAGQLMTRTFFGREIVVFRGRDGVATAVDAYCPHMGAHFGHGGTVEGSALRCPFHGFEFDHEGTCTKTGYGTTPPADARLETLPLRDINGFLLVWFSPDGAAPSWEVPRVPNEGRWSPLMTRTFTLRAHPQETTENSVDLGHLSVVHGYENVAALRPLRTEGPWLNAQYRMHRPAGLPGSGQGMSADFEVHAWGLGWSFVEVDLPKINMRTQQYVLVTPIDRTQSTLTVGMRVGWHEEPKRVHPGMGVLPVKAANAVLARTSFHLFVHDVMQDFAVWQNKRYIRRPVLATGDGPIVRYRQWARQFYPAPASPAATPG